MKKNNVHVYENRIDSSQADIVTRMTDHVSATLRGSPFFDALREGSISIDMLRSIFTQYYFWRNAFHRWFGVVIVRSEPFGNGFDIEYVLHELTEHIDQEIEGDHHGLCKAFLHALGIADFEQFVPIDVTRDYIDSFGASYLHQGTFAESLAALAGRELIAPARNHLFIDALHRHYGVDDAPLTFFRLHEELEADHFQGLWAVLVKHVDGDLRNLERAARDEITLHARFWDDLFSYYR